MNKDYYKLREMQCVYQVGVEHWKKEFENVAYDFHDFIDHYEHPFNPKELEEELQLLKEENEILKNISLSLQKLYLKRSERKDRFFQEY